MPELQLLKLLVGTLRARLARTPREAGALTLELVAIATILVVIAGVVFLILRAKAEQGVTRITLPLSARRPATAASLPARVNRAPSPSRRPWSTHWCC